MKAFWKAAAGTEAVNISHFDENAGGYDERFGLSVDQARGRARFIREASPVPLEKVAALELGCGTGNLVAALVLEGVASTCTGLDISPGMVEVARRKTSGIAGCEFRVGSASSLPFPDASFALCAGDAFLHHVLDVAPCLAEVRRVLTPGGVATFNEPNRDGYALLEFVIRSVTQAARIRDARVDDYLEFLRTMRENEGDLAALDACPYPDKHVFTEARMNEVAAAAGFGHVKRVPAMYRSSTLWREAIETILREIRPGKTAHAALLQAAASLDEIVGDVARRHFCLHDQYFLWS